MSSCSCVYAWVNIDLHGMTFWKISEKHTENPEFAWKMQKIKNQKHSPVVNAIAHQAMFSKMQNFTLASILTVFPSDHASYPV